MSLAALRSVDTIGRRIRVARKRNGWTQRELAHQLATDQHQISRWENDLHLPLGRRLEQIALALRVDVGWLVSGSDPKPTSHTKETPPELEEFLAWSRASEYSEWSLAALRAIDFTGKRPTRGNLVDLADSLEAVRDVE
ncbi:MAG: helix-turn-helix domain-containing protein [Myxococcota bacterium]